MIRNTRVPSETNKSQLLAERSEGSLSQNCTVTMGVRFFAIAQNDSPGAAFEFPRELYQNKEVNGKLYIITKTVNNPASQ